MYTQNYFQLAANWISQTGIQIIEILILIVIASKLVYFILDNYFKRFMTTIENEEFKKRMRTLKYISKSLSDLIIYGIGFLFILNLAGIDIGPILAAAGVVGITIGLGAKRLVEDIISGIIILIEDQIRVGDVIEIEGKSGLVEKVDLKMVVLRDLSGNVHYIRNGNINTITNMTKDFSYYVADIGVAYKKNIDYVIEIIKQIGEELKNDSNVKDNILEPVEIFGLDKFDDSAVVIKARIKTKPIKQWETGREFNLRLKKKFDELNIEIPFPHRTIYMGDSSSLNTNK